MNDTDVAQICALYKAGKLQREIASMFGVTFQRIGQILRGAGFTKNSGGFALRPKKKIAFQVAAEAKHLVFWGMSRVARATIKRRFGRSPFRAFNQQKKNCRARGIPMELNFAQWWAVWDASGKWEKRGRSGYVMTRPGDIGPYVLGNVAIKTSAANGREYQSRLRGKDY